MTCPHRSALASLLLLAVVLVEAACRGVRAPEPDEVAEARRLMDAAALTLPVARLACPATPRPDLCSASLRAAAATLDAARPLLAPCPEATPADPADRYLCEQERIEAVRRALPDLRRAAADLADAAEGRAPTSPAPSATPSPSAPE
jgi:hypothetical protein